MKFTGWGTQTLKQFAKALSFLVSATSSYIMNRTWTFRSKNKAVAKKQGKFFIVALLELCFKII
jgi:putative flippase GtrA